MRDSTIIYRSFYEAIIEIPPTNQAEVWKAIFEFSLNFKEIELSGISKTIFTLIKPQLEANIKRYKSGIKEKKKRTRSEKEANDKQDSSKTEANVNLNANETVKGNVSANDLNLIHAHTSVFSKTVENEIWLDEMARTLQSDSISVKKYTTQKFNEWKQSGTLTKYTLGTLISWLIKDFKQDNGRKTIKDFEKIEMEKKNKDVPVGTHDKLYGG